VTFISNIYSIKHHTLSNFQNRRAYNIKKISTILISKSAKQCISVATWKSNIYGELLYHVGNSGIPAMNVVQFNRQLRRVH
jgi:hypothetical protein